MKWGTNGEYKMRDKISGKHSLWVKIFSYFEIQKPAVVQVCPDRDVFPFYYFT